MWVDNFPSKGEGLVHIAKKTNKYDHPKRFVGGSRDLFYLVKAGPKEGTQTVRMAHVRPWKFDKKTLETPMSTWEGVVGSRELVF